MVLVVVCCTILDRQQRFLHNSGGMLSTLPSHKLKVAARANFMDQNLLRRHNNNQHTARASMVQPLERCDYRFCKIFLWNNTFKKFQKPNEY